MTQQASELLLQALALNEKERAALAASLIDSLDVEVDHDAEKIWEQEVERRICELDSGRAKAIPWNEIRSRVSAKLRDGG